MFADSNRTPRWQQRFQNFASAFRRLTELVELAALRKLSEIEQEALLSRFSVTWELAWKLLSDYLSFSGVVVEQVTPRAIIRAAFAAGLISNVDQWMNTLDARNSMAHTYNAERFQAIVKEVLSLYQPVFATVYEQFSQLSE